MTKKLILVALANLSGIVFAQATPNPASMPASPNITLEGKVEALNTRLHQLEKEVAALKTGKINVPLDVPYVSADQLLSWTTNSILTIYTYSYSNYQEVLKNIRYLFTKDGYDSYVKALESSGNLQMVQDKKWIVNATVTGTPRILKEGIAGNAHLWEVELPLTVNFENTTTQFKQNMLLHLQISRVDESVNAQGIAIQSIMAQLLPTETPAENADQKTSAPDLSNSNSTSDPSQPKASTSSETAHPEQSNSKGTLDPQSKNNHKNKESSTPSKGKTQL